MDETPSENTPVSNFTGKRPPGLTLLCILSFIGSGASAFFSFFIAIAYDIIPIAVKQNPVPDSEELLKMIKLASPLFFTIMGFLYMASLAGAILMFRLRRNGFHFYTTSQLVMLIIPSFMITGFNLQVSNVLLTASFILAYAVNIRNMR